MRLSRSLQASHSHALAVMPVDGSGADGREAGLDNMMAAGVLSGTMNGDEVPRRGRDTQTFPGDSF